MTEAALDTFWESAEVPDESRLYAEELAGIVAERLSEIDAVIADSARNWTVDRMSRIDRNLLRMAVAELLYVDDVPMRVTLDEAVEIAKAFGGDDSARFVNGILDRVAREGDKAPEPAPSAEDAA